MEMKWEFTSWGKRAGADWGFTVPSLEHASCSSRDSFSPSLSSRASSQPGLSRLPLMLS